MPNRRSLVLLFALLTTVLLALSACSGLRAQANGSGASTKDCKSCERMCEVAGDTQQNPGAVDQCKADCQQKCG